MDRSAMLRQIIATPILHRCNNIIYCKEAGWRSHLCWHLINRLMNDGKYITEDNKCLYCKAKDSLEPVQSYLGINYIDVLTSKKNPVNKDNSHIVLYININGTKPRDKGRFVKVIKELSRRESFILHHSFSKSRDIIQVIDYSK